MSESDDVSHHFSLLKKLCLGSYFVVGVQQSPISFNMYKQKKKLTSQLLIQLVKIAKINYRQPFHFFNISITRFRDS